VGDILIRGLLGLFIFAILGYIWLFVFNVIVLIVNGLALAVARGTRKLFGIKGQWDLGFGASVTVSGLAKGVIGLAFWVSILGYSFVYPAGQDIWNLAAAVAFVGLVTVWMPSVFFLGLFMGEDRSIATEP
jgi:hypothetical protein